MFLNGSANLLRTESQQNALQTRAVTSKIQSLNTVLRNLMSKKIRIDLEMKRTKVKIQNLRKQTKTDLKASLKFEDHQLPFTSEEFESFCHQAEVDYEEMLELERALQESALLVKQYEEDFAPFILET